MDDRQQEKHAKIKKKLKIIGIILLCIGGGCIVTGIVDMAISISNENFPNLFFLLIIGFPVAAFGAMTTIYAFRREIMMYAKNESAPVFNELGQDIIPGISAISNAVKHSDAPIACEKCGELNSANGNFCKNCGEPLAKICPQCGTRADKGSRFCHKCGTKFE